jgi:hypothetical protein
LALDFSWLHRNICGVLNFDVTCPFVWTFWEWSLNTVNTIKFPAVRIRFSDLKFFETLEENNGGT